MIRDRKFTKIIIFHKNCLKRVESVDGFTGFFVNQKKNLDVRYKKKC